MHRWAEDCTTSFALASWTVTASQISWLLQHPQRARLVRVDGPASLPAALRRRADERASVASEGQYRTLFEKASAPVLIIRPDDETILDANPAAARTYGLPRGALCGRSLKAFTVDVERGTRLIERILRHGTAENIETVHRRADGTSMRLLVNGAAIRYRGGQVVLCSLSDITAQKEIERRLRESEQRWRSLVDSRPEAIVISVDGEIRYINEAGMKTFGAARREDVLGRSIFDRVAPEDRTHLLARGARLEAGQKTDPSEHRLRRLDGAERIVESYSTPIRYEGRSPCRP